MLNQNLEEQCVPCDTANLGCSQIFYLPNEGEFYASLPARGGHSFKPLLVWCDAIAARQLELEIQAQKVYVRITQKREHREAIERDGIRTRVIALTDS